MDNIKLNKLKAKAMKAGKFLDHIPEEQTEAVFATALKYRPKNIMDKIDLFHKAVGDLQYYDMLRAAWFLELLDIWDDEQRQVNTVAFVEELYKFIPEGESVTQDDVSAWVQLQKMAEEEND